jgi:hypothetical protein
MEHVTRAEAPVSARDRLRLTRAVLAELDLLDFTVDLIVPDRESAAAGDDAGDFLVIGGGLRIVVKLHWGAQAAAAEPESDPEALSAAQHVLDAAPDVDAVVMVLPQAPYRAAVVDAFSAGSAADLPSGTARALPRAQGAPSVREALRRLIAPPEVDWSGLPAHPIVRPASSLADLPRITHTAEGHLTELLAAGKRALATGPRRPGYLSLTMADAAWAAGRVYAALTAKEQPPPLDAELDARTAQGAP